MLLVSVQGSLPTDGRPVNISCNSIQGYRGTYAYVQHRLVYYTYSISWCIYYMYVYADRSMYILYMYNIAVEDCGKIHLMPQRRVDLWGGYVGGMHALPSPPPRCFDFCLL